MIFVSHECVGNILRVPNNQDNSGVEVCHVLEYDTEQQVLVTSAVRMGDARGSQ